MPGKTKLPLASSVASASSVISGAILTIRPSATAKSARCTPSGITIRPPRTTSSRRLLFTVRLPLRQPLQEIHHHPQRDLQVRWGNVLVGMVTQPSAAPHKKHRHWHAGRHHDRVVTCAAHELQRATLHRPHALRQHRTQLRRARDRAVVLRLLPLTGETTTSRDFPCLCKQAAESSPTPVIAWMPYVE